MKQAWWRKIRMRQRVRPNGRRAPVRHLDIYHPPVRSKTVKFSLWIQKHLSFVHPYFRRPSRQPSRPPQAFRRPPAQFPLLDRLSRPQHLMVNVGVILVISLTGYLLFVNRSDQSLIDDSIIAGPISPDELERGTPDYPTLIPAGVDIEAQGGWARISPEGRDPVYAFVDRIDDVSISISQQPLPEEFKQNTADRIERLARDFGATEKITVGNTTVYIGSTAEGPQSIIFSRKDLLILIKSSGRVSNEQWSSYIASFE